MNIENIDKAIAIMRRAGRVDMHSFQSGDEILRSEEELHLCGTAACFAGWVAVSPEFHADGGGMDGSGPCYKGRLDEEAIAGWLEIPLSLADGLVFPTRRIYPRMSIEAAWEEVTAADVINALERIKAGELT